MSLPTITSSEAVEVEWQFDAPHLETVERWLRSQPAHAALAFVSHDERVQVDEYMDSEDWRVFRAGYTLRVRRSGGRAEATMKAFSTGEEGGPRRRLEVNQDLPSEDGTPTDAPGPVADRLALLLGTHALRPLFVIETRRLPFLVQQEGETLAVVTLDEATVHDSTEPPIRRVEIEESVPGALNRVGQFIEALRVSTGLQFSTHSKFQSGLLAANLQPDLTFDLGQVDADEESTAGEFAFVMLRRYFAEMLTHEPGTRLGEDAEELHQMRVATRRLRAAMSTFEPVLPPELYALREELRWAAAALGEVRDLDVQVESLTTAQHEAEWDEGTALGPLIEILRGRHVTSRTRLLEALDSERYDALVQQMSTLLRAGYSEPTGGGEPVRAFAAQVLRKRYRRFRREARELSPASEPAAYHAVRVRGKRLRYSVEFFSSVYGQQAAQFVSAVKSTQDLLGEHQDSDVATAWLRQMIRDHGRDLPPDSLFVMGQLVERHRARMQLLREGWPASFERVRMRWKPLRRAIEHYEGKDDGRPRFGESSSALTEERTAQYRFLRLPGFSRRQRVEASPPAPSDEGR